MYLEFNNSILNYSNNGFTQTTIKKEVNKLLLDGESIFYYTHDNTGIKIEIEKNLLNKYDFRYFQHNAQTNEYENKFIARIEIEEQQDHTNKLLLIECLLTDTQTHVLYFKGEKPYSYIEIIKLNTQNTTEYYIAKGENKNFVDELKNFVDKFKNFVDEFKKINVQNQKFKSIVNEHRNIVEINKDNVSNIVKDIYQQLIKKSDGYDYGLFDQLTYLRIMVSCNNISNIKFPNEMNKNYFHEIKTNLNPLQDFLDKFYLQPEQNENKKLTFAIIPINAKGHISTILVDLSIYMSKRQIKLEDILYSFDSSNYHHELNIFCNLIKEENKLNKQDLQLTCCCGYWTLCFIEECSKIGNIETIIKECQTGEMQLKVAFKVSGIIDMNKINKQIIQYNEFSYDGLIYSDLSRANLSCSDLSCSDLSCSDLSCSDLSCDDLNLNNFSKYKNFIKIQIKNTNKYYFLDKDNIYKSCCVNLEFIYNLIKEENSNLIISQEDKYLLKTQTIKQLQEMFELKQNKIKELSKIIRDKYDIMKIEDGDDNSKKNFVSNLAKIEFFLKRFYFNLIRQNIFLEKQMDICREYRKENNQKLTNNDKEYTYLNNKYISYCDNNITIIFQQFFEKLREHYEMFYNIE